MLEDLSPESSNLPLVLLLLQLVFSSGSHGAKAFSEDHEDLFESVIDRVLSGLDFLWLVLFVIPKREGRNLIDICIFTTPRGGAPARNTEQEHDCEQ